MRAQAAWGDTMPLILTDDDEPRTKIKARSGRSVGQPRKPEGERLVDFPRFRVKPSTLEWYAALEGRGARSRLARAAVEALSLIYSSDLDALERLAARRGDGLADALAWQLRQIERLDI